MRPNAGRTQARLFLGLATPDKQWVVLSGGDHAALIEDTHEAFIAAIVAFVSRPTLPFGSEGKASGVAGAGDGAGGSARIGAAATVEAQDPAVADDSAQPLYPVGAGGHSASGAEQTRLMARGSGPNPLPH